MYYILLSMAPKCANWGLQLGNIYAYNNVPYINYRFRMLQGTVISNCPKVFDVEYDTERSRSANLEETYARGACLG